MKILIRITLLTISILTLSECKKKNDKTDEPDYGAEYFKCKVNGVDYDTRSTFACNGHDFHYYPEAYLSIPAEYMVFGGRNCSEFSNISIRINGMEHSTGELNFLNPAFADSVYPYYNYMDFEDSVSVKLETLVEGEMNIEQFIPRADGSSPYGTFKGTFNFILTDSLGYDTLRITEGSFRFDVPQIF